MLTDNLVEFWGLNGTLTGINGNTLVSADGLEHYVAGKIAQGWNFEQDKSRRLTIVSELFNPYGLSWSVSFWMRDNGVLVCPFYLYRSSGGFATVSRCLVGGTRAISFTAGISTIAYSVDGLFSGGGQWKHVVCVHPFGQIGSIYVDGVRYSGTVVRVIPQQTPVALVMNYSANTDVSGKLDEIDCFGFWDRALTDVDVAELYAAGAGWEPSVASVVTNILWGSTPDTSRILASRIVNGLV